MGSRPGYDTADSDRLGKNAYISTANLDMLTVLYQSVQLRNVILKHLTILPHNIVY